MMVGSWSILPPPTHTTMDPSIIENPLALFVARILSMFCSLIAMVNPIQIFEWPLSQSV